MYVRHFSGTSYRDKTNEQDKLVQAFGLKAYNQVSLTEKKYIYIPCTGINHKVNISNSEIKFEAFIIFHQKQSTHHTTLIHL